MSATSSICWRHILRMDPVCHITSFFTLSPRVSDFACSKRSLITHPEAGDLPDVFLESPFFISGRGQALADPWAPFFPLFVKTCVGFLGGNLCASWGVFTSWHQLCLTCPVEISFASSLWGDEHVYMTYDVIWYNTYIYLYKGNAPTSPEENNKISSEIKAYWSCLKQFFILFKLS